MLGIYWGYIRVIFGLHWDNGKYAGNYYLGFRVSGLVIQGLCAGGS